MPSLSLPLYTERLLLSDFVLADFDAISAYAVDPLVNRFMLYGPRDQMETYDYLLALLESQRQQPRLIWEIGAVRQADGVLIGGCDLTLSDDGREGDLGYILAQAAWGYGYATEIARALLHAGFAQLELARIYATCDIANTASAHVLEKAGLRRRTTLYQYQFAKGRWWDVHYYAIERAEWDAGPRPLIEP